MSREERPGDDGWWARESRCWWWPTTSFTIAGRFRRWSWRLASPPCRRPIPSRCQNPFRVRPPGVRSDLVRYPRGQDASGARATPL